VSLHNINLKIKTPLIQHSIEIPNVNCSKRYTGSKKIQIFEGCAATNSNRYRLWYEHGKE